MHKTILQEAQGPWHSALSLVKIWRYEQVAISRLLENTAPGTPLDTVWSKYILAYLHTLSGEELCIPHSAGAAYSACVMSSDNKAERSKFNILQFAHQLLWLSYHGSHCSRLEQFTSCWNLLQEICGPKVWGLEQHATLLVEGCKIQSEMLHVGCPWQDIVVSQPLLGPMCKLEHLSKLSGDARRR